MQNIDGKPAYVLQDKYIIGTKEHIKEIITTLGTCVSLIGIKKEGIGFMTHHMVYDKIQPIIDDLRVCLLNEFNMKLEDFDLYVSGGKSIHKDESKIRIDIGKRNLEELTRQIKKSPKKIHTNKETGNVIKLNLKTAELQNKSLNNATDFDLKE